MNEKNELLEVVDEADNLIGLETRSKIHQHGLRHREVNIFYLTPNNRIIFQLRAKDKDTFANKLDSTVGGHVEPGMSYFDTAIKEAKEETGLDIDSAKLALIEKVPLESFDEASQLTNNVVRAFYAYLYEGSIEDLVVEPGKAQGFEAWDMSVLDSLSDADKQRFIPTHIEKSWLARYDKAKKLLHIN